MQIRLVPSLNPVKAVHRGQDGALRSVYTRILFFGMFKLQIKDLYTYQVPVK